MGMTSKNYLTAGRARRGIITRAGDETLRKTLVVCATGLPRFNSHKIVSSLTCMPCRCVKFSPGRPPILWLTKATISAVRSVRRPHSRCLYCHRFSQVRTTFVRRPQRSLFRLSCGIRQRQEIRPPRQCLLVRRSRTGRHHFSCGPC